MQENQRIMKHKWIRTSNQIKVTQNNPTCNRFAQKTQIYSMHTLNNRVHAHMSWRLAKMLFSGTNSCAKLLQCGFSGRAKCFNYHVTQRRSSTKLYSGFGQTIWLLDRSKGTQNSCLFMKIHNQSKTTQHEKYVRSSAVIDAK